MQKSGLGKAAAVLIVCMSLVWTACGEKSKPAAVELPIRDRALLAQKLEQQEIDAANSFGLELASRLMEEKPGGNVILSPVSVSLALSMTLNGASGSTRDAMAKTMGLEGVDIAKVNQSAKVISELIGKSSPGIQMSVANSLWLQKGWPFHKEFLESVHEDYGAKLEQRELVDPKVRREINDWVKKETNGRIPTIVDEPVSNLTKLLLVNALHLKAAWETPFEKNATKDGDFKQANGKVSKVSMMHQSGRYAYEESADYQAVRLPYGDGQLSMLVVLPKPGVDRKVLANRLFTDPAWWTKPRVGLFGDLMLPKFHIDTSAKLEGTLSKMGMEIAFDLNKADFSKMASSDAAHPPLYIGRVLHKTFLDVNEEGTEAAAATAVEMKACSVQSNGRFEMKVDKPFWLAIVDEQSHMLLFLGAVEQL